MPADLPADRPPAERPTPERPTTGAPVDASAPAARRARRRRLAGTYLLLTVAAAIVLFPLYISVVDSLLKVDQISQRPPPFFPFHPQWSDYAQAWNQGSLSSYLTNSLVMTAIIVVAQLVTSVFAAYAFAFLSFPFKRTLFVVCLATLMIPFEVTFITNLDTVTNFHLGFTTLHLFNTYAGLALPFLATGFGIFLLRQAFLQIPRDLQEAAALDGYGHWRFMGRVAVPLARPSLAALGVFSFLAAWNQYLWPLVVTGGSKPLDTVQIGLKELVGTQGVGSPNVALAGAVIAFAPLLVLLAVFQKQLVRSLTAGAVK